jgi:hypothetical protein
MSELLHQKWGLYIGGKIFIFFAKKNPIFGFLLPFFGHFEFGFGGIFKNIN